MSSEPTPRDRLADASGGPVIDTQNQNHLWHELMRRDYRSGLVLLEEALRFAGTMASHSISEERDRLKAEREMWEYTARIAKEHVEKLASERDAARAELAAEQRNVVAWREQAERNAREAHAMRAVVEAAKNPNVEAVAQAIYGASWESAGGDLVQGTKRRLWKTDAPWDSQSDKELCEWERDDYRSMARAAIAAMPVLDRLKTSAPPVSAASAPCGEAHAKRSETEVMPHEGRPNGDTVRSDRPVQVDSAPPEGSEERGLVSPQPSGAGGFETLGGGLERGDCPICDAAGCAGHTMIDITDTAKWTAEDVRDVEKAVASVKARLEPSGAGGFDLKPNVMNAPDGPMCSCGQPSRHESGWCGNAHPEPSGAIAEGVEQRPVTVARCVFCGQHNCRHSDNVWRTFATRIDGDRERAMAKIASLESSLREATENFHVSEQTVRSIAALLGWQSPPKRETLKNEICALKEREGELMLLVRDALSYLDAREAPATLRQALREALTPAAEKARE